MFRTSMRHVERVVQVLRRANCPEAIYNSARNSRKDGEDL